jgi:hypothetical protein
LVPVARRLLEQRDEPPLEDDADYWLEEIEAVLPNCRTPLQMLSLNRYPEAAVRALSKVEQRTARPAARPQEASLALSAAAEFRGTRVEQPPASGG